MTSMTDKIASPRRRSWPDYDPKAPGSPWGPVQAMYDHPTLRGVRVVMTAGHGGLGVADGIARKVLTPAAYKLGDKSNGYVWYEEDSAIRIPLFEHPEWHQLLFGKPFTDAELAQNERSVRLNYPRYFKMKEEGVTLLPKLSIGDTLVVVKDIALSRGVPLMANETVSVVKLTAGYVYVVRGGTGSQIRLPISFYESGSELGVGEGKVFLAKLASDKEAMSESDASEALEEMIGVEGAFRLMRTWESARNLGTQYDRMMDPEKYSQINAFISKARRNRVPDEAIAHYVTEIQGQMLPKGWTRMAASDKEAMRGRFTLPRGSYLPKNNATLMERKGTPEGLQIWTWEDIGRNGSPVYLAGAWAGKADKPMWYHTFRDINGQERQIQDTVKLYQDLVDAKRKRLEDQKNFAHGLQIGDILVSSWGYDQTNVDYYQVTRLYGKAIGIREIGKKYLSSDGSGSDKVAPDPGAFVGPEMKKIPRGGYGGASVKINSFASAHKWDGQPDRQTSSGWGH